MRSRKNLSSAIVGLVLMAGCNSGIAPKSVEDNAPIDDAGVTDSQGGNVDESDEQTSSDTNSGQQGEQATVDPGNAETVEAEPGLLSAVQEDAIDLAIDAAKAIATATATVLPAKDLPAAIQGMIPLPLCPAVEVELEFNAVAVVFDYADGCSPSMYPETRLTGTATGTFFFANAVDLDLVSVASENERVAGRVAGGFAGGGGTLTWALSFDLSFGDGSAVTGGATVLLDNATGRFTLNDGEFTLSSAAVGTVQVTLQEVAIDPRKSGNFRPDSGRVSVTIADPESTGVAAAIVIGFTEQTTIDETVIILPSQ